MKKLDERGDGETRANPRRVCDAGMDPEAYCVAYALEYRDGSHALQVMTADLLRRQHDCEAAEMRNRLMPEGMEWPRYKDGEPVRIGDEARVGENVGDVTSIGFYEDCWKVVIGFEDGYSHRVHVSLCDGPYMERPADKDREEVEHDDR